MVSSVVSTHLSNLKGVVVRRYSTRLRWAEVCVCVTRRMSRPVHPPILNVVVWGLGSGVGVTTNSCGSLGPEGDGRSLLPHGEGKE